MIEFRSNVMYTLLRHFRHFSVVNTLHEVSMKYFEIEDLNQIMQCSYETLARTRILLPAGCYMKAYNKT